MNSTAYCLTGTMKSGRAVYDGAVAVPRSDWAALHGTSWRILDGPLVGKVVTVEDQIWHGAEFDIWMPSCAAALAYGRHTIRIAPAG